VKKGIKVLAYYSLGEDADRGFYEATVLSSKSNGEVTIKYTSINVKEAETVPLAYVRAIKGPAATLKPKEAKPDPVKGAAVKIKVWVKSVPHLTTMHCFD